MIAGAIGGAALAAWLVTGRRARRHASRVRRRAAAFAVADRAAPPRCRPTGGGSAVLRGRARSGLQVARAARARRRRRATPAADGALAEACDTIARSLRSGMSLSSAVVEAAQRHDVHELTEVARAARLGQPLPQAIERVAGAVSAPDARLVVQVLGVAAEYGGAPAEAIDRAAATLRERAALRAERAAQAASARISTRVMTVLPFGFTGFVAASDADVREVLFRTPVGWACLTVGAALNLTGRAWARRAVGA